MIVLILGTELVMVRLAINDHCMDFLLFFSFSPMILRSTVQDLHSSDF